MKTKRAFLVLIAFAALAIVMAPAANAVVIDFTGGTAFLSGGGSGVTSNSPVYTNVDYYEENGFRLDFIGGIGIVGDYYSGANDVIHAHWASGSYGTVTSIRVDKIDGATFDLNYFELTSNTDFGGGAASGLEQAWITGYDSGGSSIGSMMLPSDDWGFAGPNPQINFGSAWDDIKYFEFTVTNVVDCFGMDSFFINEPAPNDPIPEPATAILLGLGVTGMVLRARKWRQM